jgi:hypothetical protein
LKLSKKQLIAIAYVGLSLVAIGWAARLVWVQSQWFSSMSSLKPDVGHVSFTFFQSNTTGFASLNASITNPTNLALRLSSISFVIFVNSTTQDLPQASSEVAASGLALDQIVPANGHINVTSTAELYSDVVLQLENFTATHPTDTRVFVQITIYLRSPFGLFAPSSCIEAPGRPVLLCPARRGSTGGGGAGGG